MKPQRPALGKGEVECSIHSSGTTHPTENKAKSEQAGGTCSFHIGRFCAEHGKNIRTLTHKIRTAVGRAIHSVHFHRDPHHARPAGMAGRFAP